MDFSYCFHKERVASVGIAVTRSIEFTRRTAE
jgi:hypothetical protein